MLKYWVYLIESCSKKRYYLGCTSNLKKRVDEHNHGKSKSTRPYLPWRLIYSEGFDNKKEAFKREWFLKRPKGYLEKLEIIRKHGEIA